VDVLPDYLRFLLPDAEGCVSWREDGAAGRGAAVFVPESFVCLPLTDKEQGFSGCGRFSE
jgi:hypothetical protein